MTLFIISLIAGLLTVLSPCVLPLLPVIVGGSISGGSSWKRALTVTIALGISVFAFTFLLKVSTLFIHIPASFWNWFSGGLIVLFGLITLYPHLWDAITLTGKLNQSSNRLMSKGFMQQSFWGDVLVGAALGPVFSTCSPTYFIVLASVLPISLAAGIIDILAYIIGLCFSLLVVSFVGQKVVGKLGVASDPKGWFKRTLGIIFILVGFAIITGFDKKLEAPLYTLFDETRIEQGLLMKHQANSGMPVPTGAEIASSTNATASTSPMVQMLAPALAAAKAARYTKAPELAKADAYLNTGGQAINLAQYRGKNVVLIDFWTYSCINCQRTLPYLTSWYGKYKDQGLVIIGVHTPEFAFEHVEKNVADALKRLGITYPVVLDNEYQTWNVYGNQYWPHEYLVDIDGYIVHEKIGEGDYDETEKAIQAALKERADRLQTGAAVDASITSVQADDLRAVQSPETYFGSNRNEYLGNGTRGQSGTQTLTVPASQAANTLYLGGTWDLQKEAAVTTDASETVTYLYSANYIYFVASAESAVTVEVWQDGKPVGALAGADVDKTTSTVTIQADRLYSLVHNPAPGPHTIQLRIKGAMLHAYTFTFG